MLQGDFVDKKIVNLHCVQRKFTIGSLKVSFRFTSYNQNWEIFQITLP